MNIKSRLNIKDFQQVVNAGKGEMPAFASLSEDDVKNLYAYITTGASPNSRFFNAFNNNPKKISGPVVDSGGAPGGFARGECRE